VTDTAVVDDDDFVNLDDYFARLTSSLPSSSSDNAKQPLIDEFTLIGPEERAANDNNDDNEEMRESRSGGSLIALEEELFRLRHAVEKMNKQMNDHFKSLDYKKLKKNRTQKNRCTFVNRKNQNCRGYICKVPGSKFCYAHHILSSASRYPEQRNKLY